MDITHETAMKLWKEQFGKVIQAYDRKNRLMYKSAYGQQGSKFGWNIHHKKPLSQGGNELGNLVIVIWWAVLCIIFVGCQNSTADTGSIENTINAPEHVRLELGSSPRCLYLYWSDVPEATSYDIYYGTSSENLIFYCNVIRPYPGQTLRISFDSRVLSLNMRYYFAVKACSAKGKSGFSPIGSGVLR